jgi:hypothetical protein
MPSPTAISTPRPRLAPLPLARRSQWFVAAAVVTLIAASLGSWYYHHRQMEAIAAGHLRLAIAGPRQLQAGAPCSFDLMTTHVNGRPWPVPIEWSLSTPDGKLIDRKEPTDEQGRLIMTVPADMALPKRAGVTAQLNVTVSGATKGGSNIDGGEAAASAAFPLAIRRPQYATRLATDRDRYRPGDTIYYRSLSVSSDGLVADRAMPLEFQVLDAKSAPLPDSQWVGLTVRGVGNGSFRLPVSISPGTYTLLARGADAAMRDARLAFEVTASTASRAAGEPAAAAKGGEKPAAIIEFYPEGGALGAGLENHVFFSARDAHGQPLEVHGALVNGKGDSVAKLATNGSGRGKFSFVPAAAETYQAKISAPAGFDRTAFPLPPASAEQRVAISVEHGLIGPGAPLELTLSAAKENIPLIVTATGNGLTVGQQMLITTSGEAKGTAVTVPLDDRAAGAFRVTVYDYSKSPPKVVARRLVFRQPRRLVVRAVPAVKPGDDVRLSVENEKGQAVSATLSATVLRDGKAGPPRHDLLRDALLNADVPNMAALDGLDLFAADAEDSAAALELALGCQDFEPKSKPAAKLESNPSVESPPEVIDNMDELRKQYEATLGEYRAQRTRVVNSIITLCFFGGLALVFLVTMLAMMRIVWGGHFWLPAVMSVGCCAIVTAVANDPSRMQAVDATAAGFAATPLTASSPAPVQAAPAALPPDSPLRLLAEKLARFEGDANELKADRFPVQKYALPDAAGAAMPESDGRPVAWFPLLVAGSDGRVTLPGVKASAAGLRLLIEAHGDGRLAWCSLALGPQEGPASRPANHNTDSEFHPATAAK